MKKMSDDRRRMTEVFSNKNTLKPLKTLEIHKSVLQVQVFRLPIIAVVNMFAAGTF